MKPAIERIDVGTEELSQLLERARELLPEEDYQKLKAAVDTLEYLTELVADKDTTIRHLRQLLLPAGTERTKEVLAKAGAVPAAPATETAEGAEKQEPDPQPGHGRNGADEFTGARQVKVPHQNLKHGDRCPSAEKATSTGRKNPRCWCGLSDRHRWRPPSTRWSGCVAEPAGRYLPPKSRKGWDRRSMTRRQRR